ncbi:hypothetical protein M5D96_000628 [Drosophila gunungcola]|uniref:Uncharacterized protein n=1 Tax=Drosophila gunungcola TaxID=103775 RepID=A0A9Q0BUJ7_9MUSC|nr:hypothetical protein M5D96_000628 [Drosophila gunungcola]
MAPKRPQRQAFTSWPTVRDKASQGSTTFLSLSIASVCHHPGDDRGNSKFGERKSNIKATATGANRQSAKLSDIVRCVPKEQPQEQEQQPETQQMQHQQQQQLQHNSNRQPRDNGQATGASQVNGQ